MRIQIINTIVLAITAGIIAWYTCETHKLRREMVRQNEIQLRPYVVPSFSYHPANGGYKLQLKNIGRGTAINIRIDTITLDITNPMAQWRYQFSTIDCLESGQLWEVKVWCNGQPSSFNIMLVPEANRLGVPPRVQWTLRVLFDDVEGGRYLLEFDIVPSELPEPSNVIVRPIRRMPRDFNFERINQQS